MSGGTKTDKFTLIDDYMKPNNEPKSNAVSARMSSMQIDGLYGETLFNAKFLNWHKVKDHDGEFYQFSI